MSVDISDPQIQSAYTSIVRHEPTNWLILSYGQTRDTLTLKAKGDGGIEELQKTLTEDDAYFAFVREEKAFALINFFPVGIPAVRRARALVHARAVTSLFKASNVTLTVSSADQVEISAVRAKLGLERLPPHEKAPRAANGLQPNRSSSSSSTSAHISRETSTPLAQSPATTNSRLPRLNTFSSSSTSQAQRPSALGITTHPRSVTEDYAGPPPPVKSALLLKRISANEKRDAPLPPPPSAGSDTEDYEIVNTPTPIAPRPSSTFTRDRGTSIAASDNQSEYSVDLLSQQALNHSNNRTARPRGYSGQSSDLDYRSTPTPPPPFRTAAQEQAALSRAKWAAEEEGYMSSPTTRARRGRTKSDVQREREQEEIEMARAAAEAAARRKYEKEQEALREAEEEERRKIQFQEGQRRRAADRLRREQMRREEEEREQRAAEARRIAAQERRIEEARRAEERRKEEQRRQEEKQREEEERRRSQEQERQGRMREIQRRFDNLRMTAGILLTGYVSVQPAGTIVWRRRFFQLQQDTMLFFKNAEETHKVIDSFELRGSVTGIKEWSDGYDDIRSIPYSFAVEFIDEPAWLFFADSEEDKDVLVSLILQLAKLN